jgi:dUTP pyrophosphatase
MKVIYKKLTPTAKTPQRMTLHASGFDLFADLQQPLKMAPGEIHAVPTGIAMEIPEGFEAQIRPRSGLALKLGLGIMNSPGTIDADYRGEIKVILVNMGKACITIEPHMRIAQMIYNAVLIPDLVESETLKDSARQDGGFGHTGQ